SNRYQRISKQHSLSGAATVKHGNQSKFLWRITLLPRQRTVIYIKLYATDHRNRRREARKKTPSTWTAQSNMRQRRGKSA
ncbi:MAG: hypothetical protein ACRDAV_10890, partial [Plesiomonas shigelloides]